jgi:Tfp pilus assembly protein PilV
MQHKKNNTGFFLIEAIIASAIISTTLVIMLGVMSNVVGVSATALQKTQASYLLEEGVEAAKILRNQSWTNITTLTPGTTYYLVWSGSAWSYTQTVQTTGIFTRSIAVATVSRDGSDNITTSGGTVDSGTLKMTITVTWKSQTGTTNTETLPFYITSISNV